MSIRFDADQLQHFVERPISIYLKRSPLWRYMQQNGSIEYGIKGPGFQMQVLSGLGSNVTTLGLGHSYDDKRAPRDGYRINAEWTWGGYTMSDAFDGVELRRLGGPWAKRDMLKISQQKMDRDIKYVMNEEAWLGNGASSGTSIQVGGSGTRILGITQAISTTPSSGTYAGIDRASYSGWQNFQIAGTSGPTGVFATDVVRLIDHCVAMTTFDSETARDTVDILFFTKSNFSVYTARIFNQNTNVPAGDPYQTGMVYNGVTLKVDENTPTSTIYGLNSSTWTYKTPDSKLYLARTINDHPSHAIGTLVKDIEMQGALACIDPRKNFVITSAAGL